VRRLWLALPAALALLALWHASPVWLWHLSFEQQLRDQGPPERLHAPSVELLPAVAQGWARFASGIIGLHAPIAPGERDRCGDCEGECLLQLSGGGTLAVFDEPPIETYAGALDRFAPDADDLSLLRSHTRNWATIDGLADRVRAFPPPPASFRYASEGSRGVVIHFHVHETHRYVVYAYGLEGHAARVIGLTGNAAEPLRAVLAGLRVDPALHARGSSCRW